MHSTRLPWLRAGLVGLFPLLLPFVWVLELDSCDKTVAPKEEALTGLSLVRHFGLEDWLVLAPVLLVLALAPVVAKAATRPPVRLLTHVLGAVAAGLTGWAVGLTLFFSIFTTRTLRAAGGAVLAVTVTLVVDAVARLALGAREWWAARRG